MTVENRPEFPDIGDITDFVYNTTIQHYCSIACVPVTRGTYQKCGGVAHHAAYCMHLPLSDWTRTCAIFHANAHAHACTARCFELLLLYLWHIIEVEHMDPVRDSQGARRTGTMKSYAARGSLALYLRRNTVDMMSTWLIATFDRWARPSSGHMFLRWTFFLSRSILLL
jgi:hypothetical protein